MTEVSGILKGNALGSISICPQTIRQDPHSPTLFQFFQVDLFVMPYANHAGLPDPLRTSTLLTVIAFCIWMSRLGRLIRYIVLRGTRIQNVGRSEAFGLALATFMIVDRVG